MAMRSLVRGRRAESGVPVSVAVSAAGSEAEAEEVVTEIGTATETAEMIDVIEMATGKEIETTEMIDEIAIATAARAPLVLIAIAVHGPVAAVTASEVVVTKSSSGILDGVVGHGKAATSGMTSGRTEEIGDVAVAVTTAGQTRAKLAATSKGESVTGVTNVATRMLSRKIKSRIGNAQAARR